MPEVRTDVVVTARARGFEQVQQQATRINQGAARALDEQTKGFADAEKRVTAFGRAGEQARRAFNTQEIQREVSGLRRSLQDLATEQLAVTRVMEETSDKGSPAYRKLSQEMKRLQTESGTVERTIRSLERAFKDQSKAIKQSADEAKQARGAFAQGLVQGAIPGGMFLQRGPGMRRQVMGMAAGRAARGMVGGAARMPFMGAGGLVSALQSIPVVGGMLAAPIQRSMQQAQQALQYKQVQLATMPYLGGMGLQQQMGAAGRAAGARAAGPARARVLGRLGTPEMEREIRIRTHRLLQAEGRRRVTEEDVAAERGQGLFGGINPALQRRFAEMRKESAARQDPDLMRRARQIEREQVEQDIRNEAEQTAKREAARARGAARARVRRRALGDIAATGVRFGMALPEATQALAGIQQAGGGFGVTRMERRFREPALAARTMFGVQAPVSGAFLQAGRRGGLVGGGGRAAEAMTEALRDAMKLGLEGSEINDYLQQIAGGINEWKATGIPFNQGSLQDMADRLGGLGVGGPRAMRMAGGFMQAARGVAGGGPQDVGQLMMLQTLGGLQPGRASMDDIEKALIRMEKAQFGGEDMDRFIRSLLMAGGGGAEGRRVAYGQLQKMGIGVSRGEVRMLSALQGGQLTPEIAAEMAETPGGLGRAVEFMGGGREGRGRVRGMLAEAGVKMTPKEMRRRLEEAAVAPEMARVARTPEALARAAAGAVPPELKRQAAMVNRQINTGHKLIGTMQNLENTAQTITKGIADKLGPLLEKFTGSMDGLTTELAKINQRTTEVSGVEGGP